MLYAVKYQYFFNEEPLVSKPEGSCIHDPGQNGKLAVEGHQLRAWEGLGLVSYKFQAALL